MKHLIILLLVCGTFISCQKNSSGTPSNDNPSALAANDNSSAGIYKGILVGSTGSVQIVILNGNTTIKAYVTFNGYNDTLTVTGNVSAGQAISNLLFTGKKISFSFSASSSGGTPFIDNIRFTGYTNTIRAIIAKELSTQVVTCYEGTYTGTDKGTFNCIIFGNSIIGLVRSEYEANTFYQTIGTVSGTGIITAQGSVNIGAKFDGKITGTTCSGTWVNSTSARSGTWNGAKTL